MCHKTRGDRRRSHTLSNQVPLELYGTDQCSCCCSCRCCEPPHVLKRFSTLPTRRHDLPGLALSLLVGMTCPENVTCIVFCPDQVALKLVVVSARLRWRQPQAQGVVEGLKERRDENRPPPIGVGICRKSGRAPPIPNRSDLRE